MTIIAYSYASSDFTYKVHLWVHNLNVKPWFPLKLDGSQQMEENQWKLMIVKDAHQKTF